ALGIRSACCGVPVAEDGQAGRRQAARVALHAPVRPDPHARRPELRRARNAAVRERPLALSGYNFSFAAVQRAMTPRTLYDKLWDAHAVHVEEDGTTLLYIDRHLVHEVTSPQAFEGMKLAGRKPWRISANLAVADHNVPTTGRASGIADPVSRLQVDTLDANCAEHGIVEFKMNDMRQGIVHVIGPEQGATLPGMTVVCGDSHTSTHGAFACLAWGIGTSEVEHVLSTQCLLAKKAKNMLVRIEGPLPRGISAKDVVLVVIGKIGIGGGIGCTIEYAGSTVRSLSMEGRMTLCNMSIEAGARAGLIAVDETTIAYLKGR